MIWRSRYLDLSDAGFLRGKGKFAAIWVFQKERGAGNRRYQTLFQHKALLEEMVHLALICGLLHTPFCTLINLQHDSGVIQEQGIVCDDHGACPLLNCRIAVACKYAAEHRRRKWPETPCNNNNNFFANCS